MNLIFLRHGEATDNVKGLISDKEEYNSILTEKGKMNVINSIDLLEDINIIYTSPFPRTIETSNLVMNKFPNAKLVIDNRLREINYGKYSHQKNNNELDEIRIKQINGDYYIRFGDNGENRLEIEKRVCEFLNNISNTKDDNILIVSHGSIISYIKRILDIKTNHIKKGQVEIINNINFNNLNEYIKKINML